MTRFAIYFVPTIGSSLADYGTSILAYGCETSAKRDRIRLDGIAEDEAETMTREPARYGFHATLKAPFALAPGKTEEDLRAAVDRFAANHGRVAIGTLKVDTLGAFFALRPTGGTGAIERLASACVEALDEFRAPPTARELERRRAVGLTDRQAELLARWGYPYVFDQFRFHMTLAGPLPEGRREVWRTALTEAFAGLTDESQEIDSLTLVRQDAPGANFRAVHRAALAG